MTRTGPHAWLAVSAFAVVLALLSSRPVVAGAPQWLEGTIAYTYHNRCLDSAVEILTGQYVGYYGTTDVTYPGVGDVYYGHVVVSTLGNPCAGPYINIEILPPPDTAFAISAVNPIYCWYVPPAGGPAQPITPAGGCPTGPGSPGTYGYRFNPTVSPFAWPLARGAFLEIQFPLVSYSRMSGIATNSYLSASVQAIAGTSPTAYPQQGVFISGATDLLHQDGFEAGP